MFLRHAAPGDYKIVAAMPDRDGDHIYRIKSPLEQHERVVKESLLVKSNGFFPEEALRKSSRPRSITAASKYGIAGANPYTARPLAVRSIQHGEVFMSAPDALNLHKEGQSFAVLRAATLKPIRRGIITAAALLLAVPLLIDAADAGGGRGGGVGGGFGGHIGGGVGFGGRGGGAGFANRPIVGARSGGSGIAGPLRPARFTGPSVTVPRAGVSRGAFGNRAIANPALQPRFGFARFQGRFFGSPWPWGGGGGLAIGWIGPVFWPYVYYDFSDYVFWPYAYDDFWPYAYDDIYYGIYGPYAYGGPVVQMAAAP